MLSLRCLSLLQHGTNKLFTRRKGTESGDAHQHTNLLLQVTAHMSIKFSFLNDVICHNCSPLPAFIPGT